MQEKFDNVDQIDRNERADHLADFLSRIDAEQVLGSEESKRNFIKSMSFDSFKGWLERTNGILRSIPIAERSFDGKDVALVPNPEQQNPMADFAGGRKPEYPPREEDKEDLLKEMFDLSQQMERNGDDLNDIALLISTGINAIHPFMDGNGRTSRMFNYLLETDYTGSTDQTDYLKKLLGDKGRLLVNLNPKEAKYAVADYMLSHELEIDAKDRNSPKGLSHFSPDRDTDEKVAEKVPAQFLQEFQRHILDEEDNFGFFAVYSFLKEKGTLNNLLRPIKDENGRVRRTDLRIVDVIDGLQQEDYPKLLERYWQLKKESVSVLMQAIAEPEKFKIEKSQYENFSGKNIKEIFLSELDASYLHSFKEVNMENITEIWAERDVLPFSADTLSQEEMQRLADINARLEEFKSREKQEREMLGFDFEKAEQEYKTEYEKIQATDRAAFEHGGPQEDSEYVGLSEDAQKRAYEIRCRIYKPVIDLEKKHFDQVTQFLDSLGNWKTEFTTRNDSQRICEEEKEATDSVYYVTQSGQSLRLRKHGLLEQGLSGSIEPFMEKVFFIDNQFKSQKNQAKVSEKPKKGAFVMEYVTDEFMSGQKTPESKEFVSHIRRYKKGGKIIYLNPVDGHKHRGHSIHKFL